MTTPPDYCLHDAAGNKWSGHRMPKQLGAIIAAYLNNQSGPKWDLRLCRVKGDAMSRVKEMGDLASFAHGMGLKVNCDHLASEGLKAVGVIGCDAGPWQDENAGLKGFD